MLAILGLNPSIHEIASNASYAFAHESPIYVPELDELFFSSQNGGRLGFSGPDRNNVVFKISMGEAELGISIAEEDSNSTALRANAGITPVSSKLVLLPTEGLTLV